MKKVIAFLNRKPRSPMIDRITLVHGDITTQEVDVIVNAANAELEVGGGVDGAIHRAAGPEMYRYLKAHYPEGCPTGECVLSPGFGLPASYVFHAVGPIWRGGFSGENRQLIDCYQHAFDMLKDNGLSTIAFPAISAGVYGFPRKRAARLAVQTVLEEMDDSVKEVRFVCFDSEMAEIYRTRLEKRGWSGDILDQA